LSKKIWKKIRKIFLVIWNQKCDFLEQFWPIAEISKILVKHFHDLGKAEIQITYFCQIKLSSTTSKNSKKLIEGDLAKRLNINISKFSLFQIVYLLCIPRPPFFSPKKNKYVEVILTLHTFIFKKNRIDSNLAENIL
jgi:hypothetical protein